MFGVRQIAYGGISTDLPDRDTDPKYVGRAHNVTASGGAMRATWGWEKVIDTPQQIQHMQPVEDIREPRSILLIGTSKFYNYNGTAVLDITTNSFTPPVEGQRWTSDSMGGMALFGHSGIAPRFYSPPGGGTEDYLPWDDSTTWEDKNYRAKVICNYKNYIVTAGITMDGQFHPRMVRWSASVTDTFTLPYWEPLPENDAGFVELEDIGTDIVDMAVLGDALIIYGSDTAYLMQWVGGQLVMRFQRLEKLTGLIGTGMVAKVRDMHMCMSDTDIYLHRSGDPTSIVNMRLRRTIFDSIHDDMVENMFMVINDQLDEVFLCAPDPTSGKAVFAYVWNFVEDTWTTRDLPESWHGVSGLTPACIGECPTWDTLTYPSWDSWPGTWLGAGGQTTNSNELLVAGYYALYQRKDGSGEFQSPVIERTGLDMGGYEEEYMLLSAYPAIEKSPAIVQVGVQATEGGSVRWSKPQLFTPGVDKKLDVRADNLTGALFCFRVYADDPTVFSCSGIEMTLRKAGVDG